jgi:hypothetical protein
VGIGNGKVVGLLLVAAGAVVGLLAVAWLASGLADDGSGLRTSGAIFGGALIFIILVLPLVAGGLYIFIRARREAGQFAHVERQRKMLGIVESSGQISIPDLALQLGATRDDVRSDLYDLVSKGLFSGYVDWDNDRLVARQASELRGQETCPNCGGQLTIAGKGLIRCPYCVAEIFLP